MFHFEFSRLFFPSFCSQQKRWATGVRTLRIRPTGRRCLRPPKDGAPSLYELHVSLTLCLGLEGFTAQEVLGGFLVSFWTLAVWGGGWRRVYTGSHGNMLHTFKTIKFGRKEVYVYLSLCEIYIHSFISRGGNNWSRSKSGRVKVQVWTGQVPVDTLATTGLCRLVSQEPVSENAVCGGSWILFCCLTSFKGIYTEAKAFLYIYIWMTYVRVDSPNATYNLYADDTVIYCTWSAVIQILLTSSSFVCRSLCWL